MRISRDTTSSAINLREILCRICKHARRLGLLSLRRACLLAAQARSKADICDADREALLAIADGRTALDVLSENARLSTIKRRFEGTASEEIHREECIRLKCPAHRQTVLQVARDAFLTAAAQIANDFTCSSTEMHRRV